MEQLSTYRLLVLKEDELFIKAAEFFIETVTKSIETKGICFVSLAGGSTPRKLYSLLSDKHHSSIPWDKVRVFFGDERCVPPDDKDSNYKMVEETLLLNVDIPRENVHRIRGELDPGTAADLYADEILNVFGIAPGEVPAFDLMLLGMGEDAHTASIFPGSDAVFEEKRLTLPVYVEKLDSYRVTLTPPVIRQSRRIMVLVTGENKAEALKQALHGPYAPDRFPIQILREVKGEVIWLADTSAASKIDI